MDKQNEKENLPIIMNQSEGIDTYVENIRDMVPFLYDSHYVDKMEEKMEVVEKERKSKYTYLSDLKSFIISYIYKKIWMRRRIEKRIRKRVMFLKSYHFVSAWCGMQKSLN